MIRRSFGAGVLGTVLLASGLSAASPPKDGHSTPAQANAELSDAKILEVADTANTGEVEQGTIAAKRGKAKSVRDFAAMMIKDHSAARAKGRTVAREMGVTPAPSPLSTTVKKDGETVMASLTSAAADQFDRVYLQSQVDGHEKVLKMLDSELLPKAMAPQLKALLTDMRTHVAHHLAVARSALDALPK